MKTTQTIKRNNMKKIHTLFAALFAATSLWAADILEIRPCDPYGNSTTWPQATINDPLGSGEDLYFNIRLVSREGNTSAEAESARSYFELWHNPYTGTTEEYDATMNPFGIGIVVSGRTRYARCVGLRKTPTSMSGINTLNLTDLIFTYHTEPGDFALPVKLAVDGNGTPASENDAPTSYVFMNENKWEIRYHYKDGATVDETDFTFNTNPTKGGEVIVSDCPDSDRLSSNYSLKDCGFHVKTVDFQGNPGEWATETAWRTVQEGVSAKAYLEAVATITNATTLYVWSESESVVTLVGDNVSTVSMKVRDDGTGTLVDKDFQVAAVKIQGGQITGAFTMKGVKRGETANLVLSGFNHYNWNVNGTGGTLITDFITVPVACTEPPPPSISFAFAGKDRVIAVPNDQTKNVGYFDLTLSTPYTGGDGVVRVTVAPRASDGSGIANIYKYVHVNKQSEEDYPAAWNNAGTITLEFDTRAETPVLTLPVYVYALGGCAGTSSEATPVNFKVVKVEPAEAATFYGTPVDDDYLQLDPQSPIIAEPAEDAVISVEGNVARELTIKIEDNYFNRYDTNTGYRIYWRNRTTDAEKKIGDRWGLKDGVLYKMNEDGTIDDETLPSVTYATAGTYASTLRVLAPNDESAPGPTKKDVRHVTIEVTPPATVGAVAYDAEGEVADTFDEFADGDATSASIEFTLSEAPDGQVYAFLAPSDPDVTNYVYGTFLTNSAASKGVRIKSPQTTAVGELYFLDGAKPPQGTALDFDIVLCTSSRYDPTKIVTKYVNDKPLELTLFNVEPALDNVEMNGYTLEERDGKLYMGGAVAKGTKQTFHFTVLDAEADLAKNFVLNYTIIEQGVSPKTGTNDGANPNEFALEHTFSQVGTATVTLKMRDKDMASTRYVTKTFYVEVVDLPSVEISADGDQHSFYENSGDAFKVSLSQALVQDTAGLEVTLTVTANAQGDKAGDVTLGGEFTAVAGQAGVYTCTYKPNETEHYANIISADGTAGAASKFTFVAKVTTQTEKPNTGTKWCDYYLPGRYAVTIINIAPKLTVDGRLCEAPDGESDYVVELNSSNSPIRTAVGESVDKIVWSVDDVTLDLAKGITVVTRDSKSVTTVVYDTADHEFTPTFKNPGTTTVSITASDRDGGSITAIYYYSVDAARLLHLYPVGPSGGNGSKTAKKYAGAGCGEGHVWAEHTLTDISAFVHDYNCQLSTDVRLVAQGYSSGDVDNGTLSAFDKPIDANGNRWTGGDYYTYTDAKDSFFYCWVHDIYEENGSLSSEIYGAITPEVNRTKVVEARVSLPTEADEQGDYAKTVYEAVFAKELLVSDNMGDINQDGIPDAHVKAYEGFGIFSDGDLAGNDMDKLSDFNDDGDYFPVGFAGGSLTFIPGPTNTWEGRPFLAKYEVRGYYDPLEGPSALNDALTKPYQKVESGFAPDKNYADPEKDTTSTLTPLEWDAFQLSGKTADEWSPERPTDPTVADTDEDGIPDGYEYYVWYKATVGWKDDDKHMFLSGRAYNPKNPFNPTYISPEKIAEIFDPLVDGSRDWDTIDTDNDGLLDIVEFTLGTNPFDYDTDGDLLPDGYEVLITETNPCKAATDGTHADGTINPDGDTKAAVPVEMNVIGVYNSGEKDVDYYCCPTEDAFTFVITNEHKGTLFSKANGATTNRYVTAEKVKVIEDTGRLAGDVNAWALRTVSGTNVIGRPIRFTSGTVVLTNTSAITYYEQKVATVPSECYVAWQYASNVEALSGGLARGKDVSGAIAGDVCYTPADPLTVLWLHHHVYEKLGFDPRTGWNEDGTFAPTKNTSGYTHMDEFLSMTFFYRTGGITAGDMVQDLAGSPKKTMHGIWLANSTHPRNADTDGDQIPDGWEFYTMRGPAALGQPGLPNLAPDSNYSPLYSFYGDKNSSLLEQDYDADALWVPQEYSGILSSARYNWNPVYPAWRNKQYPTDPWDGDTDGDGMLDGVEGGRPLDDEKSRVTHTVDKREASAVRTSFMYNSEGAAGGGLNPLSVDTDLDGLPDPWETQFAGTFTPGSSETVTETRNEGTNTVTITRVVSVNATWNMDGMDGTVPDERIDYDSDGLDNWQEYMVGAMRCWRYDDSTDDSWGCHLMEVDEIPEPEEMSGAILPEQHKFWYDHLCKGGAHYNPNFVNGYYDPCLAYFSYVWNEWDSAFGQWYMYRDGIDHDLKIEAETSMDGKNRYTRKDWGDKECPYDVLNCPYPLQYICCDPTRHDTDFDGMDDYYEIYHGMNPLLGAAGLQDTHGNKGVDSAFDVVYNAYLNPAGMYSTTLLGSPASALNNWWRNAVENHPTLRLPEYKAKSASDNDAGYDFIAHPWLNGLAVADPDGDGIRNQEEAIFPKVQAASTYHHTDPTPLWMTDTTYTNSLVRKYYRISTLGADTDFSSWTIVANQDYFEYPAGQKHYFAEFPGFTVTGPVMGMYTIKFSHTINYWGVDGWAGSFEENEGYDSDHDYLSDYEELQGKTKSPSDPQVSDDPLRRQAMWFNGTDAFLQTPVATSEQVPQDSAASEARQNFLYFTAECWAKPDGEGLKSGKAQTLVERAVLVNNSSAADQDLLRRNFFIGITKDGVWTAGYDSTGTGKKDTIHVEGDRATTNWTHLAVAYDGEKIAFYVNGNPTSAGTERNNVKIRPESGVNALAINSKGEMQEQGGTSTFSADCISLLVGASPATRKGLVYDWAWRFRKSTAIDREGLATPTRLADYTNFYWGYVDEVRIWDGARTAADIKADYDARKRYTAADALENRETVYLKWKEGGLRSPASTVQLPPQLMYHFSFDHVPGAILASDAIAVPAGFNTSSNVTDAKSAWSRPSDWTQRDWASASDIISTVYGGKGVWVPWIGNTVAHLPRFDLTTLDSTYWSEDFAGAQTAEELGYTSFGFPRNAEVSSRRVQMGYATSHFYDRARDLDATLYNQKGLAAQNNYDYVQNTRWSHVTDLDIEGVGTNAEIVVLVTNDLGRAFRFAARDRHLEGDDLLPMGGAYPKRISAAEGGMWDNLSGTSATAADAWAQVGPDSDNNGLPDWWEEYARQNYCKGMSPKAALDWETLVDYKGRSIAAWQAYLRDLAKGLVKVGSKIYYDDDYIDERDADRDGMPDWWEELYGLDTTVNNADDDPDNDGLSNYQEYILGEVYPTAYNLADYGINVGKINLSPSVAFSSVGQVVPDYYLCYTNRNITTKIDGTDGGSITNHFFLNEYFGEMVTDHDFMEDWWENLYGSDYTSAKVYDPSFDKDGDGWSTWAECRASLWGNSFSADLISKWTGKDSSQYVPCRPQPIVGVRITYFKEGGIQDISGHQLIVRTTSGQTKRVDATFVVPSELDGQTKFIGGFEGDTVLHGHLSPGMLNVNSIMFDCSSVTSDKVYTWNYDWYNEREMAPAWGWVYGTWSHVSDGGDGTFDEYRDMYYQYPHIELEGGDFNWEPFVEVIPSTDLSKGTLIIDGVTTFGWVDCTTGEYELDMSKFSKGDVADYVFRVTYTSRLGHEWPQTIYLSDTKELETTGIVGIGDGYVREGKNTIEAFMDLNGDGAYTVGEPYGVVQNVDVGWHKTPVVTIELKDMSHVVPRFSATANSDDRTAVLGANASGSVIAASEEASEGEDGEDASSGLSRTFAIRRKTINGQSEVQTADGVTKAVPERTLATKTLVLDSRAYLTEADVLASGQKFDLDAKWLVSDCRQLDLDPSTVTRVGYAIEESVTAADGIVSNRVVMTFENTFNSQRTKASLVAPLNAAPVYSCSPTFAFSSSDETMTGYRLQVRKAGDRSGALVYDSDIQILPGRVPNTAGEAVYEVTPPIYAGVRVCSGTVTNAVFADGADYEWRVALYNAKYAKDDFNDTHTTEADVKWSANHDEDWATFQMDIGNENRYPKIATGYGCLTLAVRYYGPTNVVAAGSDIYVEAYESGDFRGQPLARAKVTVDESLHDLENVISTNVVLRGIAPGKRFVLAFIDFNGNGQRDAWESWGYVNHVGKGVKAIYNPIDIDVTGATADWKPIKDAQYTLFMEDTDVDRNEIPDCLPGGLILTGTMASDEDGDGIADGDEGDHSTDKGMWDTDGDAMPDGWEAIFADTDPTIVDAGETVTGDVMAFARVDATFVTFTNAAGVATRYMLDTMAKIPERGENVANLAVWTTYDYPTYANGTITTETGVGTNLVVSGRVTLVEKNKQAILVHHQVYEKFGFDKTTAVTAEGANTKQFTALDKYLVVRYREVLGLANEKTMNANGVNFKPETADKSDWAKHTLKPLDADNDADGIPDGWELYVGASPWNFGDCESDIDQDGARLIDEYGKGETTDPTNPHTLAEDMLDGAVKVYQLTTPELQASDGDYDLLSNWQEFLLATNGTFGTYFDVESAFTITNEFDYFRTNGKTGAERRYAGFYATDHDLVEDSFEGTVNAKAYNADADTDGNGWSLWAEARSFYQNGIRYSVTTNYTETTISSFTTEELDEIRANYTVLRDNADVTTSVWSDGTTNSYVSGSITYLKPTEVKEIDKTSLPIPNISLKVYGKYEAEATEVYDETTSNTVSVAGALVLKVYKPSNALTEPYAVFDVTGEVSGDHLEATIQGDGLEEGDNIFVLENGTLSAFAKAYVGFDRVDLAMTIEEENSAIPADATSASLPMGGDIYIRRNSIYGYDAPRLVWYGTAADYLRDVDVLTGGSNAGTNSVLDLDWQYLVKDAAAIDLGGGSIGLPQKYILYVKYDVIYAESGMSVVIDSFTKYTSPDTEPVARPVATLVAPTASDDFAVRTAQPTFTFADMGDATAFALEIATGTNAADVVWSATNRLAAARKTAAGYVYTAPVTIGGGVLADGSNYFWRVSAMNAKWSTISPTNVYEVTQEGATGYATNLVYDASRDFSAWGRFKTAVDSSRANTGRGALKAEIRYYGASTRAPGDVIVEVHDSADFANAPVAVKRLSSVASLASLAVKKNADRYFEADANVAFDGLAEGDYYVMAFIDANGNGKRDYFESWGYLNRIGTEDSDLFTPATLTVSAAKGYPAAGVVFLEDTDANDDAIPDCIQDAALFPTDWREPIVEPVSMPNYDWDWDGLGESDEVLYGTYEYDASSDYDDYPDGFEVWAGMDPLSYDYGWEENAADVMAYAIVKADVYVFANSKDPTNSCSYAIMLPKGDTEQLAVGKHLTQGKAYPTVGLYVEYLPAGAWNGYETTGPVYMMGGDYHGSSADVVTEVYEDMEVMLMHDQVFSWFGFISGVATPGDLGNTRTIDGCTVGTRPFYPLEKYLVSSFYTDPDETVTDERGVTKKAIELSMTAPVRINGMNKYRQWGQSMTCLNPTLADFDYDGVPDGWELYVGKGYMPEGLCVSPWRANDGWTTKEVVVDDTYYGKRDDGTWGYITVKRTNTVDVFSFSYYDKDGHHQVSTNGNWTLAEWYNGGKYPSNPYDLHTFHADIDDPTARKYNIETSESQLADNDFDGLSNWNEYQAAVKGYGEFDVNSAYTLGATVFDYFRAVGSKYAGEVLADHDMIADAYEDQFMTYAADQRHYATRYEYDANRDGDNDGWSNYAESRAGTRADAGVKLSLSSVASEGDYTVTEIPVPVVKTTISYNTKDLFDYPVTVKAWKGDTVEGMPDAIWTVAGGSDEAKVTYRFLGKNPGVPMTLNLGPGSIAEGSVKLEVFDPYYETVTDTYDTNGTLTASSSDVASFDTSKWSDFAWFDQPFEDPSDNFVVGGTIDYTTGAITIPFDCDSLQDSEHYWNVSGEAGKDTHVYEIWNLPESYFRIQWRSKIVESGNTKTIYLSVSDESAGSQRCLGHLREGENTFVAFADVNKNGVWDEGEPMGIARHVNVGWSAAEVNVELTENSTGFERFFPSSISNATTVAEGTVTNTTVHVTTADGKQRVRIVRTGLAKADGTDVEIAPRTVFARDLDLANRFLIAEVDYVRAGEWDLDWSKLLADAKAADVAAADIKSATYEVYLGDDDTTAVYSFRKDFDTAFVAPTISGASTNAHYLVRSAQPVLQWVAAPGYTAFALEIASDEAFGDVVYATTNFMPAALADGCMFKPDCYVGDALKDQTTYYWRVQQINAKFTTNVWSEAASFRTAVDSSNYDTGYGALAAEVRYYGPATNTPADVVVGVYASPDFSGAPVALQRLDIADTLDAMTRLHTKEEYRWVYRHTQYGTTYTSRKDMGAAFGNYVLDRVVTNTVVDADAKFTDVAANAFFDGIAPGTYYVMAFIDANTNGVRDAYETWGYADKLGQRVDDVYVPVPLKVVATKAAIPSAFLVMEDTDANGDGELDVLQDWWTRLEPWIDTDGDGLSDDEEEDDYGTDPQNQDTDGDGMPDGWEEKFAGTDPFTPDGYLCADDDVMAYAEVSAVCVTDANGNRYLVAEAGDSIAVGDDVALNRLVTTYEYPVMELNGSTLVRNTLYGVGTNMTDTATVHVEKVEGVTAVLVHAQVYDEYGFDPNTANATAAAGDWTHTKAFTALDKYLVLRYLEAQGLADEAAVNAGCLWGDYTLKPLVTDGDKDGVPDGWELYVMFGPEGAGSAQAADAKISPWNVADARQVSPGDANLPTGVQLTNLGEYGLYAGKNAAYYGTAHPTDPWVTDTDADNVIDYYYHRYFLWAAGEDFDGDGLSHYAEYLVSQVFRFADLDPENPKTDGSCVDYFRKKGDLYIGEMLTDHDQVDDAWEQLYMDKVGASTDLYANRYLYDPSADWDGDGWSNWAESKAGTNPEVVAHSGPDGEVLPAYPIPTIAARVIYSGSQDLSGALYFQAWSQKTDPGMTGSPDGAWTTASTNLTRYIGVNPGKKCSYYLGAGALTLGTFAVRFCDLVFKEAEIDAATNEVNAVSGSAGNARWYPLVYDDGRGILYTSITNQPAVSVGTVDYATGLVTIDFGCDALQGIAYDRSVNGSQVSDGTSKSTGAYSNFDKLDLSRSYVKFEWTPMTVSKTGNATYYLSNSLEAMGDGDTAITVKGHIREGKNSFVVFCDTNEDGGYTPGEPFGFVKDVDVGWQGGAFDVELTEVSPVFARINLRAEDGDNASDREVWQSDSSTVTDISSDTAENKALRTKMGVATDTEDNELDLTTARLMRIRVMRVLVDGENTLGVDQWGYDVPVKSVVLDKYLDLGTRSYIHEGDFIAAGELDVGWSQTLAEVYGRDVQPFKDAGIKSCIDATNITYAIVLGEGEICDSNLVFRCVVNRTYDAASARFAEGGVATAATVRPVIDRTQPQDLVYGARPTFRWAMQNGSGVNFNSYTAFRIVITGEGGTVWQSAFRPLPPKDASGWYVWTLDEPIGTVIPASGNYSWRVAMYNAKFKDYSFWNDEAEYYAEWYTYGAQALKMVEWSEAGTFTVDMNNQQAMNDHGYSSIAAAVKYAGPACVTEGSSCECGPSTPATVIVQAFDTADFAGSPVGQCLVEDRDALTNTAHIAANAVVCGLPQTGTYYLRAFIDTDGDGVKDDWESWGAADEPVTLSTAVVTRPTVGIWIEDADTDGDWFPDAYEMVKKGNLTSLTGKVKASDNIIFSATAYDGSAGISTGLSGVSLTTFRSSQSLMNTLLGQDLATEISIGDIRAAVERKVIDPTSVKITALTLAPDGKTVTLEVAASVSTSIAGEILGQLYDITPTTDYATVTVNVYKKNTLAEAGWTLVKAFSGVQVGRTAASVTVDISTAGVDMTSGFYKVDVVQ